MRPRISIACGVPLLLVLAACASVTLPPAGTPAPPNVKVVVMAEEVVRPVIDVQLFEDLTRAAMAKYAAGASPSTITVHLQSYTVLPGARLAWNALAGHAVPTLSPTPWTEPVQPTVSLGSSSGSPLGASAPIRLVHGYYTIENGAGQLLERRSIVLAPSSPVVAGTLADDRRMAARLAKRLATLMRQTS